MISQRICKILFVFALSCSTDPPTVTGHPVTDSSKPIASVDITELRAQLGKITIIDVRSPEEYNRYHIPGAQNIPLGDLESQPDSISELSHSNLYLVCATGRRSNKAAIILKGRGFSNPINVRGGTEAWRAAGHQLERRP